MENKDEKYERAEIPEALESADFENMKISREDLEKAEGVYVTECSICGDTLIEFRGIDDVSCDICGWDHVVLDGSGWERGCIQSVVLDYMVPIGEDISEGDPMCYGCEQDIMERPDGTVVIHRPSGEKFKFSYSSGIALDIDYQYDELTPAEKALMEGIVAGTHYVQTDAWRGYYEIPEQADGWVKVIDGWHSTMVKTDASEKINALGELSEDLGIPIAKAFTTTSNICSTGVTVYIRESDIEEFKEAIKDTSLRTGRDGGLEATI